MRVGDLSILSRAGIFYRTRTSTTGHVQTLHISDNVNRGSQVLCRHFTLALSHKRAVTMRRLVVRWPCTHPLASISIKTLGFVPTVASKHFVLLSIGMCTGVAMAIAKCCVVTAPSPCPTSAQLPCAGLSCAGHVHILLDLVVSFNETKNYKTLGFVPTVASKHFVLLGIGMCTGVCPQPNVVSSLHPHSVPQVRSHHTQVGRALAMYILLHRL